MKIAIVYSSKTGNTCKVAEAIAQALPTAELYAVENAPAPDAYDLIFIGFWVDKGTADKNAQPYFAGLGTKNVAIFATLGAYADSQHAQDSLNNAAALCPQATVVGRFICQGAIDPKLIAWMKTLPADHPHAPDDARRKRWSDAESHPDTTDLENARAWAAKIVGANGK